MIKTAIFYLKKLCLQQAKTPDFEAPGETVKKPTCYTKTKVNSNILLSDLDKIFPFHGLENPNMTKNYGEKLSTDSAHSLEQATIFSMMGQVIRGDEWLFPFFLPHNSHTRTRITIPHVLGYTRTNVN